MKYDGCCFIFANLQYKNKDYIVIKSLPWNSILLILKKCGQAAIMFCDRVKRR